MTNMLVTYARLTAVSNQVEDIRIQLNDLLHRVDRDVSDLVTSGFRTPTSSAAYDAQFGTFVTSTTTALRELTAFSDFLSAAVEALGDADSQLGTAAQNMT